MSWSPDQDVVAMVTGSNCILMMTREFDPVLEVSIDSEEFGEGIHYCIVAACMYHCLSSLAQPITVGWGKKETQFHGSLGKQSAKQPISDKVSQYKGTISLSYMDTIYHTGVPCSTLGRP